MMHLYTQNSNQTFFDLSHPIVHGDRPYPGDPATEILPWYSVQEDGLCLQQVKFGTHSSTHMDSPAHLLAEGKSLDQYPLSAFFHEAYVFDARSYSELGEQAFASIPDGITALLFCTGWEKFWNTDAYFQDPPLVSEVAIKVLLQKGIRLFGFDSSSCDALASKDLPIHHHIFAANGLIVENLANLDTIVGEVLSLIALPLRIKESDGAPTRVVAFKRN